MGVVLMSSQEAVATLGISRALLARYARTGIIPFVQVSDGQRLFPARDVRRVKVWRESKKGKEARSKE